VTRGCSAAAVLQRSATAIANVARVIATVHYHFVIAVWRAKKAESTHMNPQKTIIAILTTLSASLALADDFKAINGKEYKNVTVTRVEADGILLRTKTGISKVYFVELPKDVQQRFHYGSATPTGKAVTQRIDKAEGANHAAEFVDAADRFAQRVAKKLDERIDITGETHTRPGRVDDRSSLLTRSAARENVSLCARMKC
jgi:hypothetical protein